MAVGDYTEAVEEVAVVSPSDVDSVGELLSLVSQASLFLNS